MTSQEEIIWLAGLLEGEGCFGMSKKNSPYIQLLMTDRDIIVKASQIMSCSQRILTRYRERKTAWQCSLWGLRAIIIMRKVLPYMGERRTSKISEVISLWDERKLAQENNKKATAHRWYARNGSVSCQ